MIGARFSPRAIRDLDDIPDFIAADNPDAAERVRKTILDTADFLNEHTERGKCIRKASARHLQIRWFDVRKFRNHLIFHQPFQDGVMIVRVLRAAQDWTRFIPVA